MCACVFVGVWGVGWDSGGVAGQNSAFVGKTSSTDKLAGCQARPSCMPSAARKPKLAVITAPESSAPWGKAVICMPVCLCCRQRCPFLFPNSHNLPNRTHKHTHTHTRRHMRTPPAQHTCLMWSMPATSSYFTPVPLVRAPFLQCQGQTPKATRSAWRQPGPERIGHSLPWHRPAAIGGTCPRPAAGPTFEPPNPHKPIHPPIQPPTTTTSLNANPALPRPLTSCRLPAR